MITINKTKGILFTGLFALSTTFAATNASAYIFEDWGIDPDGLGTESGIVNVENYLDLTGQALITNNLGDGTFTETGEFRSKSVGLDYADLDPYLYATFDATGTLGENSFAFDNVVDSLKVYNQDGSVEIGRFDLLSGGGELDAILGPLNNGTIEATFQATFLAQHYWFAPNGDDLYDFPVQFLLGFATTNAKIIDIISTDPDTGVLTEFTVSNNGQFQLAAVPEPATFMLFGAGLIGLAGLSRKRRK